MAQKTRILFLFIISLLSVLLLAILQLGYYSIIFPVLCSILGMLIFLAADGFSETHFNSDATIDPEQSPGKNDCSKAPFEILTILFFIFFSFSLLSMFHGEYTKSVAYYFCIAICAGIVMVEIFTYRTQIQGYGILLKTVLLSMNIVFANHLVFIHGISLPDLGRHFDTFVMSIIKTGQVSSSDIGFYNIFSIHHIFASEIAILTGYTPLSIYLLFGSFVVAIGALFIFIIGKRFINFRFGLVAAVLFTCLDYYLMYGEHPEHQAYNYGFAFISFTIILYTYRFQKPAFYVLFILSAVALFFTHHLSAAMVFITVCSLVIIDISVSIQTRKLSIPSKYIAITFSFLLVCALSFVSNYNPAQYVFSVLKPYFMDMYSLIVNLVVTPSPTISIPVTPIPVTPSSVPTPPYVPPMAYDKLPLITLFENTFGSSLLVLVAVWGFCLCIKKRFGRGDFLLLSALFLSVLLGLGIFFSYVFFLPDRLYPFLQIFSLVFLGAFGILWLYNVVPSRKKTLIVGCICILVAMMSFFSLASIVNGFETSPFIGENIAYPKLYTTSQDVSFDAWSNSYIRTEYRTNVISAITAHGIIEIDHISGNHFVIFDRSFLKTGIVKSGGKFGQHTFITLGDGQVSLEKSYSSYYDNGLIIMMNNQR